MKGCSFQRVLRQNLNMLRQIEWGVQNGHITMNGVLTATTLFFENFVSVSEPLRRVDLM